MSKLCNPGDSSYELHGNASAWASVLRTSCSLNSRSAWYSGIKQVLGRTERVQAAENLTSTGTKIMKLLLALIICGPVVLSAFARADDQCMDAAIRDAVGGRVTAYVASDVGGHNHAITIRDSAVGVASEVVATSQTHRSRPGRGPYHAAPPNSKPHWKVPSHD